METNLDRLIHCAPERALPLTRVLGIARDVALALAYLHPTCVHRDLKPAVSPCPCPPALGRHPRLAQCSC